VTLELGVSEVAELRPQGLEEPRLQARRSAVDAFFNATSYGSITSSGSTSP
jgi:hypothetical protein